jgi:hypothetical protein
VSEKRSTHSAALQDSVVLPKKAQATSDPDPAGMRLPIEPPLLSQLVWQHPQRGEITHQAANNSFQGQLHDKRSNVDSTALNDTFEQISGNLRPSSRQKPESRLHPTHSITSDYPLSSDSVDTDDQPKLYADINTSRRPSLATRRATSDDSITFHWALSRASSFGDDTRFEHVREQMNNRLKALKDSFYDSDFRLPSIPSLPKVPKVPGFFSFPKGASFIQSTSNLLNQQPRANIKSDAANTGATAAGAPSQPFLAQALDELEGDLVLLGGYRGSVLRSAETPHRQLWVPLKVGLNLRKVDLEVGFDDEAEERMKETIVPDGMLKNIGPVDISRRLFKRLKSTDNYRSGKLRIHDYGYDWRLNPHKLSRDFIRFLEDLPCNSTSLPKSERGAVVVAHSLGGLITRHSVNYRPDLFAGVVFAGVPQSCVNILGPLRNGDDVMFSSRVLTAQVSSF